jgi:hypothetical protein
VDLINRQEWCVRRSAMPCGWHMVLGGGLRRPQGRRLLPTARRGVVHTPRWFPCSVRNGVSRLDVQGHREGFSGNRAQSARCVKATKNRGTSRGR